MKRMIKLLLLFTLVPLLELWLLIEVSEVIGAPVTIILVALTGFAGVLLAKSQGLSVLRRMHRDLLDGKLPGEPIFDGVCILLGGAFLLTPGFITDLTGLFLLIPYTRKLIKVAARRIIKRKLERGALHLWRRW
jgi:UPF0716 protein FxsA